MSDFLLCTFLPIQRFFDFLNFKMCVWGTNVKIATLWSADIPKCLRKVSKYQTAKYLRIPDISPLQRTIFKSTVHSKEHRVALEDTLILMLDTETNFSSSCARVHQVWNVVHTILFLPHGSENLWYVINSPYLYVRAMWHVKTASNYSYIQH